MRTRVSDPSAEFVMPDGEIVARDVSEQTRAVAPTGSHRTRF